MRRARYNKHYTAYNLSSKNDILFSSNGDLGWYLSSSKEMRFSLNGVHFFALKSKSGNKGMRRSICGKKIK